MKTNQWITMLSAAALLSFAAATNAQDNNRQGRPNWDPAQMQQRIMDSVKERLEITDEAEWKALQPLVQKVMDAQRQAMGDRVRGMMGGRRPGGDSERKSGESDRNRGGSLFGTPSKESELLQRAIDGKASGSELKAALAKFVEARKAHQTELESAQAELRKVLTPRQEAIATLSGWL